MRANDGEKNTLELKVARWLKTSGAALEMKVAQAMLRRELSVQQGHYYRDPEEDVSREIDVIARREVQIAEGKRLGAYLVIECKYAPTPWVLFRGRPHYDEGGPNLERIATTYGEEWLQSPELPSAMENVAIFHQEPRVGYALATTNLSVTGQDAAGSSSRDHDLAYQALLSATKASRAHAMSLSESETTTFGVVFPIVVVRGKLFEAWLDGEEPVVKEIRRGQVYWTNPAGERPTIVDVIADDRVDELAGQFRETAEALFFHGKDAALAINTTGVY